MYSSANTSSFPQFRRFPKEIRLFVWERAIPEPRIVHIVQDPVTRAMKSYTSIPEILRVNHESFSVASKQYHRAFRCCKPGQDQPDEDTSYVWFDFERDFLLIDYDMAGELWPSSEDWLAISTNPLRYSSVRWFPDYEVKRIRNLAWYTKPSYVTEDEHIWRLFTGLRKWFLVQELMGSGIVLEPRNIHSSEDSIRKIRQYHLMPSYDLSFWDVCGEEDVNFGACMRLFDIAKKAYRPMLGPRELLRHPSTPSMRVRQALEFCMNRSHLNNAPLPEITYKFMISPSLKNKFKEEKLRYEAHILQNIQNHEEHKAENCNCDMTGQYWRSEMRIMARHLDTPRPLTRGNARTLINKSRRSCATEDFSILATRGKKHILSI
ncbi:uncharacterized protein Bfra_004169 [Botrytis fragariae]|uniref:2EXR domain-containing protein n=1 Tax=Botrytis fragariae TaxID=1964551 RepID=A0A8H6AV08_9HELO|nr:uncharacterized protein Bfra_004169 [Botrytis fragariae]KAF5874162.1 hypothetical protein Bfra_004169 [Botrytis fragariae]